MDKFIIVEHLNLTFHILNCFNLRFCLHLSFTFGTRVPTPTVRVLKVKSSLSFLTARVTKINLLYGL